jgi:hypothetical protein
MDEDPKCRRCGSKLFAVPVPEIRERDYDLARDAANLIWKAASQNHSEHLHSVACLTAALLFKRAARQLMIPNEALPSVSAYYMHMVREIILERRRQAAEDREAN